MRTASLRELLNQIERFLPEMKDSRSSNTLANDLYEAASYWVDLGHWVLEGNTAINFPVRAAHELELLDNLIKLSKDESKEEQGRLAPLFKGAQELLTIVSETVPPEEGHLGFLKTVGELFAFVEDSYGFKVVRHEPTFWIDDLLFMYGDARYATLPQIIEMNTSKDVENWFGLVADVFRCYGQGVLSNEPGIFERLKRAQDDRDAEYTSEMNRRYGQANPLQ